MFQLYGIKAQECHHSTKSCQFSNEILHTSICKKDSNMILTTNTSHVTYPVVMIEVEDVKCRELIDTGAGSPSVSSKVEKEALLEISKPNYSEMQKNICTLIRQNYN